MKKLKYIISALTLLISGAVMSQTYQDVLRYSQPQYSGTARSVGMGGAFGSLGGDFSAIGINPAGIAAYRSSEFSFTPSIILNKTESNTNGVGSTELENVTSEDNKTKFAINQIGYVGTYRPMRESNQGIISTHFGIGYNRNNNFNYRSMANARNVSNSMTDMFLLNTDEYGYNSNGDVSPNNLSGITALAFDSYVIDTIDNIYNNFLYADDKVHQTKIIDKEGYSGDFNFTFGANFSNFLLIGGSLDISLLNYSEDTKYFEVYSEDNDIPDDYVFERYTISDYLDASGTGVNLKLGVIITPIKGLRLGLAYHSPTWYNIEENYGTSIDGVFFNQIDNSNKTHAPYDARYDDYSYDYNFRTPDKVIASASYIFGKLAILSFDYERINYTNAKFNTTTDNYDDINIINYANEDINDYFTTTSNYRAGVEFRLNKQFSLRGGYAFQASPYKNLKDNEITSYSAGLGYRFNNYFFDIAYKYSTYKKEYDTYERSNDYLYYENSPHTKTDVKDSNFVFTFGVKF